jgi:hypothetical protein
MKEPSNEKNKKMKNNIDDTIMVWLQNGNLYYSIDDKTYFAGFNGGMGNFNLYELPIELTSLIVDSETSQNSYTSAVIGELRSTNQKPEDFQGYFVKISKVISANLIVDC